MSTRIDRDQVSRLVKSGAVLVDVLPESMYDELHVAGAINIPLDVLVDQAARQLSSDQPIIVYCYDSQ